MQFGTTLLFVATTLLCAASAFADSALLIISDIDDTLKQTNMHANMPIRTLSAGHEFAGLSALYRAIQVPYSPVYVSGARPFTQNNGRKFLRKNGFPAGMYFGRQSKHVSITAHKVDKTLELTNLLSKQFTPVLIGDNGQKDREIYAEISRQMEAQGDPRKPYVFIHQIFDGAEPLPGQIPWLTSADLAIQFYTLGWVAADLAEWIVYSINERLASEQESQISTVLPMWIECRDFAMKFAVEALPKLPDPLKTEALRYRALIAKKCLQPEEAVLEDNFPFVPEN